MCKFFISLIKLIPKYSVIFEAWFHKSRVVKFVYYCSSVAKLCPTLCNPHGLHHARFPCSSLSHRICSNSVMLSNHLIFCCSLLLLSPQSYPLLGYFSMSQLFVSDGQSIRASTSVSVLPVNIQLIFFRIDWFDLLAVQGLLSVFSSSTNWKHQFFSAQPSLWSNCHICMWLLEKP